VGSSGSLDYDSNFVWAETLSDFDDDVVERHEPSVQGLGWPVPC
jgi:hypothetical protein